MPVATCETRFGRNTNAKWRTGRDAGYRQCSYETACLFLTGTQNLLFYETVQTQERSEYVNIYISFKNQICNVNNTNSIFKQTKTKVWAAGN
jgi:hypothetical protein